MYAPVPEGKLEINLLFSPRLGIHSTLQNTNAEEV